MIKISSIASEEEMLNLLDIENSSPVSFHTLQLQVHVDWLCTCKITQDKKGSWLFPCSKHTEELTNINNKARD